MSDGYIPQKQRDTHLTPNYLTLAKYIFIQAIKDASALRVEFNYVDKYKTKAKEKIKEDAIRWLKSDAWWWIHDVAGIDADPIRFIKTIRNVENMEMPADLPRYVGGTGQKVEKTADNRRWIKAKDVKKMQLDHEFSRSMQVKAVKQKAQQSGNTTRRGDNWRIPKQTDQQLESRNKWQ